MPAETEPHERTLMCWPARREIWGEELAAAHLVYAEIANQIEPFEPVTMIVRPEDRSRAAALCGPRVELVELAIDDSWSRDSGPICVLDEHGRRLALDFGFNGWGQKFGPYANDDALAARWATRAGMASRRVELVLEGGSIAVDGEGTLATTQQCLLHPNRNPDLARVEIEAVLERELGASTTLWLPFGLALDDDTDGHVDNVAAFPQPGIVLLQGCQDRTEADHERLLLNLRWALGATDARGRRLAVVEVPVLPFAAIGGERVPVPYLNLYAGNGFVIVPVTGHRADEEMLAIIGSCYPGRRVIPMPGEVLALGGGGPHCITQQIPAARRERSS